MAALLVACLSATMPAPAHELVPGWVIDLGFRAEVERWVAAAAHHPAPPVVRALGAARYTDRAAAHRVIQEKGEGALRDVARAMADRDAEIADRGRLLYEIMFSCRDCRGAGMFYEPKGVCESCHGAGRGDWWACRWCDGAGVNWADRACSTCGGSGSWLFEAALTRPRYGDRLGLVGLKRRAWFVERDGHGGGGP